VQEIGWGVRGRRPGLQLRGAAPGKNKGLESKPRGKVVASTRSAAQGHQNKRAPSVGGAEAAWVGLINAAGGRHNFETVQP